MKNFDLGLGVIGVLALASVLAILLMAGIPILLAGEAVKISDWLGFAGAFAGAMVTLIAAFVAWKAVQVQIAAQQAIADRQAALAEFDALQRVRAVVADEHRLMRMIRHVGAVSKISEDTILKSPIVQMPAIAAALTWYKKYRRNCRSYQKEFLIKETLVGALVDVTLRGPVFNEIINLEYALSDTIAKLEAIIQRTQMQIPTEADQKTCNGITLKAAAMHSRHRLKRTNRGFVHALDSEHWSEVGLACGYKIDDFASRTGARSILDLAQARERHVELHWLRKALQTHNVIPNGFDDRLADESSDESNAPRLLIGSTYLVPDIDGKEILGVLTDASVIETERAAYGTYRLQDGRHIICTSPTLTFGRCGSRLTTCTMSAHRPTRGSRIHGSKSRASDRPGKSHSEVSNGGSEAGQTDILPSWPYLKPTPISVTTGFAARNAVLLDRSVMVIPRSPSNSIEPALYNGRWPCAAAIAARTGHVGSGSRPCENVFYSPKLHAAGRDPRDATI
jgi:hypothetical protein